MLWPSQEGRFNEDELKRRKWGKNCRRRKKMAGVKERMERSAQHSKFRRKRKKGYTCRVIRKRRGGGSTVEERGTT